MENQLLISNVLLLLLVIKSIIDLNNKKQLAKAMPKKDPMKHKYTLQEFKELTLMINMLIGQETIKFINQMKGESETGDFVVDDLFIQNAMETIGREIFSILNAGLFDLLDMYLQTDTYIRNKIKDSLITLLKENRYTVKTTPK